MATIIEQQPLYDLLPVGQDVIFTVSNVALVAIKTKVKFIARVYISDSPITIAGSTPVGTFKTTPNNAGVGMFDFRPIIESFVNADNLAGEGSGYKGTATTLENPHSIHLIDKYSTNKNLVRYLAIEFGIEFLGAENCALEQDDNVVREQCGEEAPSSGNTLFNGYLKHTDTLDIFNSEFGYNTQVFDLNPFVFPGDTVGKLLTNAPLKQFATENDYGTISMSSAQTTTDNFLYQIKIVFTELDGTTSSIFVDNNDFGQGGFNPYTTDAKNQILYFGCYPGNLRNWDATFQALISGGTLDFYTVQPMNFSGNPLTESITIKLLCPNLKGYEPIRLTWLNQWGVWDYYTFKMKSTKTISTKGSTYTQLAGTWNESKYRVDSYKGGRKSFRVNATEKIKMNTDFVSESESEWFEELINSPEVYILEGFQTDTAFSSLNTYVVPVRLTTSSFTRKTVANDKLMQYTFEVEKSKTLRTQSV